MPWIGPAIGGAVGLVGDLMSQQGQQATNAMSMEMMKENQQWQAEMSNTQMQRRVEDLKLAGLNPMLAAGGPGAAMGSPVMPNLQNPSAAFGNLGAQATNAAQLSTLRAQIRDTNASAALKEAQTPSDDVMPVDDEGHISASDVLNSPHGGMLGKASVAQALSTIQQINATTDNIKSQTNVNNVVAQLRSVDLNVAQGSASSVIQKAVNDAKLGSADVSIEQARAKVLGGPYGAVIQAAESVLGGGFVGQVIGGALSKAQGAFHAGQAATPPVSGQVSTSYNREGSVTGSTRTEYKR